MGSNFRKGVLNMDFREILDIFENNDRFLILTHKSPDGDTLGSGFALCEFLRGMGKLANVVNSDELPERYSFLYKGYEEQDFEPEHIIAVDIADPILMGSNLAQYQQEGKVELCIDHHVSNKQFAQKTYVEPKASAAALILYKLFKFSGRKITEHIAECLYTGIATDTGCFKYENTTPEAHIACAELMGYNIDYAGINRRMFDIKSKARIKVEQSVINHMEYFLDGQCAVISLTQKRIEQSGVEPAEFDGLASIPLSVEGVKIGITIKQRHEDVFKISVRTSDEIDASEFCSAFGGGGHIRASGCEITGDLETVKKKLVERTKQVLRHE